MVGDLMTDDWPKADYCPTGKKITQASKLYDHIEVCPQCTDFWRKASWAVKDR